MIDHARTAAHRLCRTIVRRIAGAAIAAVALLGASRANAWNPGGWSYFAWPYAYDLSQSAWSYMNESDTQWCLDITTSQWAPWGQPGSPRSGWNYFMMPYVYASDSGRWFYLNESDTQYSYNLRTGRWSLFGVHESNNSTVVPVAAGTGTTANNLLTRTVSIQVASPLAGLTVGPAYACGPTSGAFYGTVRVANNGNTVRAFVRFGSILYRNAGGSVVASNDFTYLSGAVGRTPGGTETATCIWPGEVAYFTLIDAGITVADVASIHVATLTSSATATQPAAAIIPLSASYTAGNSTFGTAIKNVGQSTGILDDAFNKYILFDGADRPLTWHYFMSPTIVPADRSLAAGEAGSISATLFDFNGLSAKAYVRLDYESASGGGAARQAAVLAAKAIPPPPADATAAAWAAYAERVRNAREEAKALAPE